MKKIMKLQTKITIFVISVAFVSISIILFFTVSLMSSKIEKEAKTNIMNVAEMAANAVVIKDALINKDPNREIEAYVNNNLKNLDQIEYIIVADIDGIRYSHPNHDMIGRKFVGGDEIRVLEKEETYISEAFGTLGKSLRAFAPIYDKDNKKEIGFVSVGTLTNSIEAAKKTAIIYIILIGIGGLAAGVIGAFLLANNIKNTLLGLEPYEITKLYNEKMAILDAVYEGIVAIDNDGKITLINDSALRIMNYHPIVNKKNLIGMDIENIIPNSRLINILDTGEAEFDKEQKITNTIIMTNRIPIKINGKIIGVIASFRDKTEVTKLAEELTGVKKMAWSLRAQNHEFMNKLHTISGLLQLEEYEEAMQFISEIAKVRNNISNILTKNIKDKSISALLLSKYNKAEEYRINLVISENSKLTELPQGISAQDIVSILGNLIENSLDEVKNDGTGLIKVFINQTDEILNIKVKDNGGGIPFIYRDKIFKQGFTTKKGQRGVGMYIVKKIIDQNNGSIDFHINDGVTWNVILPMKASDVFD